MVQLTQEAFDLMMIGHQAEIDRKDGQIAKAVSDAQTAEGAATEALKFVRSLCEIVDIPLNGIREYLVMNESLTARLKSLVATEKKYSELRRKKK